MNAFEFLIYKIPSEFGPWLAAFENDELVFLGCYNITKISVEKDLSDFLRKHYDFVLGDFTPAKWTQGNFWDTKHRIKLQGTDFQMTVWMELLKIPRGKTVTYSDLANKLGKPDAVRAVASAVAKNPVSYWIPCHRAVSKNLKALDSGPEARKNLLQSEGAI